MKKTYSEKMFVNNQNNKSAGTDILNIDTIRGCPLACESCYAKKLSAIAIENFEIPVPVVEFSGKVHADKLYRIGNYGDPCLNWSHSEALIKKKGIHNNFVVTKLVSLKGFTGFFKRLQVSVDTLNPVHYKMTMQNIWTVMKEFPDVELVIRLRSFHSHSESLMSSQYEVVRFANQYGLPLLETRLRFNRKEAFEKYNLVRESYEYRASAMRPKHGLVFATGATKYYDCDLYGNKCRNCSNCELPFQQHKKKGIFIADHSNRNKRKYSADVDLKSNFQKHIRKLPAPLMLPGNPPQKTPADAVKFSLLSIKSAS